MYRCPGTLELGFVPAALRPRHSVPARVSRSHSCCRYPSGDRILVSIGATEERPAGTRLGDMYEAFYNFREKPFAILPDPGYLYSGSVTRSPTPCWNTAWCMVACLTVIAGDVDCGKTTLTRHLLNRMDQDVTVGLISNTRQAIGDLLKWMLLAFDQRTMPSARAPDLGRPSDLRALNACLAALTNK